MPATTLRRNPRPLAHETAVPPGTPGWSLSHWRGDTSLGIAYWLNGILLGSLLPSLVLIGLAQQREEPFRRFSGAAAVHCPLALPPPTRGHQILEARDQRVADDVAAATVHRGIPIENRY